MAENDEADEFEEALEECGFGIFNICVYLTMFCSVCAMLFATTSIAFILPLADCDLDMSSYEKGILMGISFIGMIVGSLPWGFFADVYGRKPIMIVGCFMDAVLAVMSGLSQSSTHLIIAKFLHGLVVCGSYAAAIVYISEIHTKYLRGVALMVVGVFITLALLIIPIMAYFIIPSHNTVEFGGLTLYNWNFYLFYNALPAIIACIAYILLPESPRFLLSKGRNEKALKVIGIMYDFNKPKNRGNCPFKGFTTAPAEEEDSEENVCKRFGREILDGLKQAKTLFSKSYVLKTLLVCTILFSISWVLHSMRLWFPQMFHTFIVLKKEGNDDLGVCMVVEYVQNNPNPKPDCTGRLDDADEYFEQILQKAICVLFYCIMVIIVKFVEGHIIVVFSMCLALIFAVVFYFSNSITMVSVVSAFFISSVGIVTMIILTVAVNNFPTRVRATIVVMALTSGRLGSSLGNVVIPHIIAAGCIPLFAQISAFLLITLALGIYIPKTRNVVIQ